jgi:hypothetical protein
MKMDLREVGIDGANWIRLAQEMVRWLTFMSAIVNIRVHKESRILFDKLSNYHLFKEYPAP